MNISEILNNGFDINVVNKNNSIFPNQIKAAKDILTYFDMSYPRCNHLILKGRTQAGKTGVLTSLYNIIVKYNLASKMNVNKVIYLTADNSMGLPSQTKERIMEQCFMDSNRSLEEQDIPFYVMRNEDMKNKEKNLKFWEIDLENTIIFIDESHYGTSKDGNILIKYLNAQGITLRNNTDLADKNIYIISTSATPYNEIYSDLLKCKGIITLDQGDDYIGIEDFYKQGQIEFVNQCDKICDRYSFEIYLNKIYNYFKELEERTGERKSCIMRLTPSEDFTKEAIQYYAGKCGFNVEYFDSSKTGIIDYKWFENQVERNSQNKSGKYFLAIIKGALRMGVSINKCKKYIGAIYDYSDNKLSPEITEQGLLGRISGHYEDDNWKNKLIFISKSHGESLLNYYNDTKVSEVEGLTEDTPNVPLTTTEKFVYKKANATDSDTEIRVINEQYQEYELGNLWHEVLSQSKDYIMKTFRKFIKRDMTSYGCYLTYLCLDCRKYNPARHKNLHKGYILTQSGKSKKELIPENVGKKAYYLVLDKDRMVFRVYIGTISYVKKVQVNKVCKRKVIDTMNTAKAA